MPVFESSVGALALTAMLAYLLGAVPFGVLMARAFGLGDLRKIGSGNIGATNVLRTGNRTAAALTLLLDGAKGACAVLLARQAGPDAAQVAALAAFLGHLFPVYLRFRGGKGVATFLGVMLGLAWPVGLACCATWLVTAAVLRYSSLAALVAAALTPVFLIPAHRGDLLILSILLTALVYLKHQPNIARLRTGTEPRIGQKAP